MGLNLELIRLTLFTRLLLIADFYENKFAEFTKGGRWRKTATAPESLIQETRADYLHLLANDSIGQAILSSVSGVPTTFFFDGEGAYLGGVVGSAEKEKWEEIIHGLLEEM